MGSERLPIARQKTSAAGGELPHPPARVDRLSVTTWPDTSTETLSYDADGNVLTRQTRKGDTLTFTYDTLNRLVTKAAPGEATVTYGYDLAGHPTSISDTSAAITIPATSASYPANTSYDAMNRPLAVSWSPAPAQTMPDRQQRRLCLWLRPDQPADQPERHRQQLVVLPGGGGHGRLYRQPPEPVQRGRLGHPDLRRQR